MKLPLRLRVFGLVYGRFGSPVSRTAPEDLPALRARQARTHGLRAARIVMGRHAEGVAVEDVTAANSSGEPMTLRVYRPPSPARRPVPAVLNIHGGGFATGSLDQSEWLCREVCYRAGVVVVSVDYRLAPEHPWPTAPEDCFAALRWVVAEGERLGIDVDRLAVMGDSAGGNLSAVLTLMARDRGGPRLRSQILIYPGTDFVETYPSEREHAAAPVLKADDIATFSRMYRAGTDGSDPYASPLRAADHTGLPPALVQTAEHDPLLDEGHLYARTLEAAGTPVRYTEYVGAAHGFTSMPGLAPQAHQALWEIVTELRARLVDG